MILELSVGLISIKVFLCLFEKYYKCFALKRFIVVETTWRMKPGNYLPIGIQFMRKYVDYIFLLISGTNQLSKQIFDALGSKLHEELKRLYPKPGIVSILFLLVFKISVYL